MDAFVAIAERKIQEAMKRGEFDNLAGKGKPLKLDDDSNVPEDLRMAYRILKNCGCVPPEVELHKEIMSMRDLIASLEDDEERRQAVRRLNFKLMKFEMMRQRPLNLEHLPEYRERLEDKIGG